MLILKKSYTSENSNIATKMSEEVKFSGFNEVIALTYPWKYIQKMCPQLY